MFIQQINSGYNFYPIFQAFLEQYMDAPNSQSEKYKVPFHADLIVAFDQDVEQVLHAISLSKDKEFIISNTKQVLSHILGVIVIYNHIPQHQTVDISICRIAKDFKLTKTMTFMLYEYLFNVLKARMVISRVSSWNIGIINGFRGFNFNEQILIKHRGKDVDEHVFTFKAHQWRMIRRNFSGSHAEDKKHLQRLREKHEPQSIPLQSHWQAVPKQIQDIALYLPKHKRDDLYNLITKQGE